MKRQVKLTMIWLMTWAGMFVLVLYSPVGSPDLYSPNTYSYSLSNRGVIFDGKGITNYKHTISIAQQSNYQNEFSIPVYVDSYKNTPTYAINSNSNESNTTYSNQGLISAYNQSERANGTMVRDNNYAGGLSNASRNNNEFSNQLNSGILLSTTDLTGLPSFGTKQSNTYDADPITEPGGDPTGDPVPIEDGWGFLIALAVIYGILKRGFLKSKVLPKTN